MVMLKYYAFVGHPPSIGNRYMSLWSLSMRFRDLGFSIQTVVDLLLTLNDSWAKLKKTPEEVNTIIERVFK